MRLNGARLWDGLGALSGAAFAVLMAVSAFLGDPYDPVTDPNPQRSSALIARTLVEQRDEARIAAYLSLVALAFLFFFVGYLRERLRRAEGEGGWLSSVAFGGGLVAAAVLLVETAFVLAASEPADYGADTQVAKTYFVLGWNYFSIVAPPAIAVVAASTAVGFRSRAFPRVFNWFGGLLTVALVVLLATNTAGLGAGVFLLWVLVASLVLFFRPNGR